VAVDRAKMSCCRWPWRQRTVRPCRPTVQCSQSAAHSHCDDTRTKRCMRRPGGSEGAREQARVCTPGGGIHVMRRHRLGVFGAADVPAAPRGWSTTGKSKGQRQQQDIEAPPRCVPVHNVRRGGRFSWRWRGAGSRWPAQVSGVASSIHVTSLTRQQHFQPEVNTALKLWTRAESALNFDAAVLHLVYPISHSSLLSLPVQS